MTHIDVSSVAPAPPSSQQSDGVMAGLSLKMRIAMVAIMPLFLMTVFILCFVSASHAPAPYHLPIVVSGSPQATSQISDELIDATDENALIITTTTSASDAEAAVRDRTAAGAVIIDGSTVKTFYASGAGSFQASIIKSIGNEVASGLGTTSTATDVAPTRPDDPAGSSLFFFMAVCTLGAFLSIVVLTMTTPRASVGAQIATVVGSSALAPVIGFSVISAFTGGFSQPFATIAAVLGVGMLYSLVIGLLTTVLTRIAGLGGILIAMILLIAMNFPSSGGSSAAGTLPPFWQLVHNAWMGSAMTEWVRGITYFDGEGIGRWVSQLIIWLIAAAVALLAVVCVQRLLPRWRHERRSRAKIQTEQNDSPSQIPDDLCISKPRALTSSASTPNPDRSPKSIADGGFAGHELGGQL